jgi:hypothetical protein
VVLGVETVDRKSHLFGDDHLVDDNSRGNELKKLSDRIQKNIEEGNGISEHWRTLQPGTDQQREELARRTARWLGSCHYLLEFLHCGTYCEDFRKIEALYSRQGLNPYSIGELIGVLEGVLDEVENGFLGKLTHLIHAELYFSVLEQAEMLFQAGHLAPAAVLGRIIIERWLKDEAEKVGIDVAVGEKASVINDKLQKAQEFSTPRWRLIQWCLDIGNAAAHGRIDQYTVKDVEQVLQFLKANSS